jgi:DNA-binding NarL/FixJ family response regulator
VGAVATLENGPVPLDLARALLELGRVRRRRRARRSAREALGRARDLFERIGDVPFQRRAAVELERLASTRGGDGLTETERRVAELVVTGAANRAVAAALFVSVRTVESHLQAIYRKLGVRSRAELLAVLLAGPGREP